MRASSHIGELFCCQIKQLLELNPASSPFTCASRAFASFAPKPHFFDATETTPAEQLPKFRNATKHWIDREAPEPLVEPGKQRLLTAGVIGVPNAGKSTLTNALVGRKVAAVSHKTNTTYRPTLGAFTEGSAQVVLHDTPGIVSRLASGDVKNNARIASAWRTAADCDLLLFIMDAARQIEQPDPRVLRMISMLGEEPLPGWTCPPTLLLLNKCDRIGGPSQPHLQSLIRRLEAMHAFKDVYLISALHQKGLPELRDFLVQQAQPGAWKLDATDFTDQWPEDVALEVVREKVFQRMHKELPYTIRLRHELTRVLADNSVRLEYEVLVPHEGVRGMLVGSRGAIIGKIGTEAREELEMLWRMRVHLFLRVSVGNAA